VVYSSNATRKQQPGLKPAPGLDRCMKKGNKEATKGGIAAHLGIYVPVLFKVHFFFCKPTTVIEYFINQFYTGLIVISLNERKMPHVFGEQKVTFIRRYVQQKVVIHPPIFNRFYFWTNVF